ncbi:MAG: rod shape-determining protein MreC [Clostridiales bacterium]|nr:rod shape-determining protein MreC [Clostridiales bacterium]
MRHRKKNNFPAKYVLLFMSIFCIIIIVCSVKLSISGTAANTVMGYVIVPMQKGVNLVGSGLTDLKDNMTTRKALMAENEELTAQLEDAQEQLNQIQIDKDELEQLRELYDMDNSYSQYDKLAASVIGKDSGNWFSTFIIDKGKKDGVGVGMNIIADGALAGVVIDVGPNYATVRSIIDDNSNISCRNLSTGEIMVVSGSLQSMNTSSRIIFSDLRDSEDAAGIGDEIVTSDISDLYLPGIPVGYITDITADSNKLTKSGELTTIANFSHLEKVFVILETKSSLTDSDSDDVVEDDTAAVIQDESDGDGAGEE